MKTKLLFCAFSFTLTSLLAQTSIGQQRVSSPPGTAANLTTNQFGVADVTITNQTGAAYSLNELAGQLATLKSAVEQTMPVLTAFNAHFSNNSPASSRGQELANAISGVLSGALHHGSNQTSTASSSGVSPGISNFAQVLGRLITTNSTASGSVSLDPNTLKQLETLQADLKPVMGILQNLRVGNNLAGTSAPSAGSTQRPTPAPTGR